MLPHTEAACHTFAPLDPVPLSLRDRDANMRHRACRGSERGAESNVTTFIEAIIQVG
jgi:hypothetical protein